MMKRGDDPLSQSLSVLPIHRREQNRMCVTSGFKLLMRSGVFSVGRFRFAA